MYENLHREPGWRVSEIFPSRVAVNCQMCWNGEISVTRYDLSQTVICFRFFISVLFAIWMYNSGWICNSGYTAFVPLNNKTRRQLIYAAFCSTYQFQMYINYNAEMQSKAPLCFSSRSTDSLAQIWRKPQLGFSLHFEVQYFGQRSTCQIQLSALAACSRF